jgi:hypothetical protein
MLVVAIEPASTGYPHRSTERELLTPSGRAVGAS